MRLKCLKKMKINRNVRIVVCVYHNLNNVRMILYSEKANFRGISNGKYSP